MVREAELTKLTREDGWWIASALTETRSSSYALSLQSTTVTSYSQAWEQAQMTFYQWSEAGVRFQTRH